MMFKSYKKFFIFLIFIYTHESIHCINNQKYSTAQSNNTAELFATFTTACLAGGLFGYALYAAIQNYIHEWDYTHTKSTSQDLEYLLTSHNHASELRDIINYLDNPTKDPKTIEKHTKGYVFSGGTEQLFIQALKNSLNSNCFCISCYDFFGQYAISCDKVENLHQSATKVRRFFDHIKKSSQPCLIILKQLQYLGPEYMNNQDAQVAKFIQEEIIAIKNQLIKEINNLHKKNRIFILAATATDSSTIPLDLRYLFQNHLYNNYNSLARAQIIKLLFKSILSYTDITETDLAPRTFNFSETDYIILREQIINKIALHSDKIKIKTASELIDDCRFGPIKNNGLSELKTTAYHEAGHVILMIDLNTKQQLDKVSILARGDHLGLTQSLNQKSSDSWTVQDYLNEICMYLGGYAAEEILLSEKTLWEESSDYKKAYKLATLIAQHLKNNDAYNILDKEYKRAIKHFKKNQKKLTCLANALLTDKVLMADEVYELFEKSYLK